MKLDSTEHLELPKISDIQETHKRISSFVHRTPVVTSESLDTMFGVNLFFKCENLQKTGSFKIRGAISAILSLSKDEIKHGVITHSSGNHGAAVARAANWCNLKAYVVMPENAPQVKKMAVKSYGAKVIECSSTLEAREKTLAEVVEKTSATFIHPYNHFQVICGQGTTALEFYQDTRELDVLIIPVGGGGLLSGCSVAIRGLSSNVEIFAAEPEQADDTYRSFKAGNIIHSKNPQTIADGLRTSLGSLTFSIIKENVSDVITVSEKSIKMAMKYIWERMKIIVEPSAAVPFAAIVENSWRFSGKKVGIILSGGNIDFTSFIW